LLARHDRSIDRIRHASLPTDKRRFRPHASGTATSARIARRHGAAAGNRYTNRFGSVARFGNVGNSRHHPTRIAHRSRRHVNRNRCGRGNSYGSGGGNSNGCGNGCWSGNGYGNGSWSGNGDRCGCRGSHDKRRERCGNGDSRCSHHVDAAPRKVLGHAWPDGSTCRCNSISNRGRGRCYRVFLKQKPSSCRQSDGGRNGLNNRGGLSIGESLRTELNGARENTNENNRAEYCAEHEIKYPVEDVKKSCRKSSIKLLDRRRRVMSTDNISLSHK
jgi:hypothetical protein